MVEEACCLSHPSDPTAISWSGPAVEGHLAPLPAFKQQAGEKASILLDHSHLHELCFQSVLSSNGTVYTFVHLSQTHHFTSLAMLLALE